MFRNTNIHGAVQANLYQIGCHLVKGKIQNAEIESDKKTQMAKLPQTCRYWYNGRRLI